MLTYNIGGIILTRIEDDHLHFDATKFFPDQWTPDLVRDHLNWLSPIHFDPATGTIHLSVHSWLIQSGHQRILVDTCFGNHKKRVERPQGHMREGSYLQKLGALGIAPEQIDVVLCTHLHYDHVGWNTRLVDGRWVPTFPNARYVFSRIDRDHFDAVARDPSRPQIDREAYFDSVLPILEAGQAVLVDGACELAPFLIIEPTPGHTPGHVALKIRKGDDGAILCGDVLHHPIQIYRPEMYSLAVVDIALETATRERILTECAEHDLLMLPAHFAAPHATYVRSAHRGFEIDFSRMRRNIS